jgi:hypothetical protein
MNMLATKRELLGLGLGAGMGLMAGPAFAQGPSVANPPPGRRAPRDIPNRQAKTSVLFKTPWGYPNAIAVAPEGLWIGEQKEGRNAAPGSDPREAAWLADWNGKLLKTVMTDSRNTSGMAYGDGCVWMGANAAPEGIFQTDMNSRTVSHRQIPLGPADNGGGCHGLLWNEGKLWIAALRLRGILRVDPKAWTPEFFIPVNLPEGRQRLHGIAWDNGAIWIVTGNDSKGFADGKPGLAKYAAATGELLETVDFLPGSSDPHGLAMHNGSLISCDAGLHPGWPNSDSPTTKTIFRIDLV